jgi:predicted  nucleic acid-binding Zn-ribbon protein
MADLVKQAASGEVFLHESLNDMEKEYLLEVSGQIQTTIKRAAVQVGLYLLEVKERFRENGEFSGPNGWYQKWFKSIGLNHNSVLSCTNAALLASNNPDLQHAVDLLSGHVLRVITQPHVNGGTSQELQRQILKSALSGEKVTERRVGELKNLPDNKLQSLKEAETSLRSELAATEEAFESYKSGDTKSRLEYDRLRRRVRDVGNSLKNVEANIEKLLNAPDPVAEEPKEEPTPTPPEPVVIDPNPALEQQLADLQKQLEESEALATKVVALEEAKRKLQLEKKAAEDKLHQIDLDQAAVDPLMSLTPERRKGALQAHIAEFRKGCHTLALCRQYDDGGLPGISQLEGEVVDAIKDWLHVLSPVAREDLTDALYQSTALTPNYSNSQTINVQALN